MLESMWPFKKPSELPKSDVPVFFSNTLTRSKDRFFSSVPGIVTLYSCGPTVYSEAHIGNLRTYVMADLVARTLSSAGYHVRRVINITDVGHLVSDADTGEDKMTVGAIKEGKRAQEIAERYATMAIEDMKSVGLLTEDILFPRATHYIKEQIAMIELLQKKGHTYKTKDGIYFDTTTFSNYGILGGLSDKDIKDGTNYTLQDRMRVASHARIKDNQEKINAADFALWKFSEPGKNREQEWRSPWGLGFPGWHIECSAMSKALLGTSIDIHTGGMDLIPIHHNNEIAQSEAVSGRPFSGFWIHGAFLLMNNEKASKSVGNVVYLHEVLERGYHPRALRYLFLQASYRSPLSFSWETLSASSEGLERLWKLCRECKEESKGIAVSSTIRDELITCLRDDLGTPKALALLWETLKDEDISAKIQWGVILAAEEVLGLLLSNPPQENKDLDSSAIPEKVHGLVAEREEARKSGNYVSADELRIHIQSWGYAVEDGSNGPVLRKS